ncbi:hypothetical protein JD292_06190 [Leucobacter sp. CSA2]|uniref:Uncharacterized protein n=1 Tax=Leucobacter edaphi TaxID=2796472 RepID=A0A934QD81_9MICO|nr:hypothetical protein [Leucobacter edaphi]MBK0421660.1 hypothetical protein [Leucobacter edaphi]
MTERPPVTPDPGDDREVDDATRAVARPAAVPDDDATRVVQRRSAEPEDPDATRAVPRPAAQQDEDDATRKAPRPAGSGEQSARDAAAPGGLLRPVQREFPGVGGPSTVTRTGATTGSRNPAPPVEEPLVTNVSRDVAALMFKSPLDPRRRVRNTSVAGAEDASPRQGVSRGIPVVYGPRAPEALPVGVAAAPAPPSGSEAEAPPAADRTGLPSTARINRRERLVTLIGGAALVVVGVAGLWWIAVTAFGS